MTRRMKSSPSMRETRRRGRRSSESTAAGSTRRMAAGKGIGRRGRFGGPPHNSLHEEEAGGEAVLLSPTAVLGGD